MMYLKDPVTNVLSVSLTFLVISFVLVVGFSVSHILGYSNAPESLLEMFYACAALYFGRRVNIGSKTYSSSSTEEKTDA